MSVLRPFRASDLFKFNNMYVIIYCRAYAFDFRSTSNLDIWTETVNVKP